MKYFVAIPVPDEVKEHLAHVQRQLKQLPYRFVSPNQFHVTLRFLGELTEEEAALVKKRLHIVEAIVSGASKITSIGGFPSKNYARVLWVGCEKEQIVTALKKAVDRCVSDVAKQEEHETFVPHITLGRTEDEVDLTRTQLPTLRQLAVPLTLVRLMTSTLTPKGPIYRVEEEYFLKG